MLGQRTEGRRPLLFGGRTMEDIWAAKPRTTDAEIREFYRDLGAWLVFRQLYRHRRSRFSAIIKSVPRHGVLLEFGCGVAPVAWRLMHRLLYARAVIVDIPSAPIDFAEWRFRRAGLSDWVTPVRLEPGHHLPDPLSRVDVVTVLETFEHLANPASMAAWIVNIQLQDGGMLWEDFIAVGAHPSGPDLATDTDRLATYREIRSACDLVSGVPPETPGGGGIRGWRHRGWRRP